MQLFEELVPVDYYSMIPSSSNSPSRFSTFRDLPQLGKASRDNTMGSDEYLLVAKGCPILARPVPQFVGGVKYFVDQLVNPCTVTFAPGGLWQGDVIIGGLVATVHNDAASQTLMKMFSRAIRKNSRKITRYWVGQEAAQLLTRGFRLTDSASSPVEFDLREN